MDYRVFQCAQIHMDVLVSGCSSQANNRPVRLSFLHSSVSPIVVVSRKISRVLVRVRRCKFGALRQKCGWCAGRCSGKFSAGRCGGCIDWLEV